MYFSALFSTLPVGFKKNPTLIKQQLLWFYQALYQVTLEEQS